MRSLHLLATIIDTAGFVVLACYNGTFHMDKAMPCDGIYGFEKHLNVCVNKTRRTGRIEHRKVKIFIPCNIVISCKCCSPLVLVKSIATQIDVLVELPEVPCRTD